MCIAILLHYWLLLSGIVSRLRAIRRKLPDVEIESLAFHQDNAPAHRAQETIMTVDV